MKKKNKAELVITKLSQLRELSLKTREMKIQKKTSMTPQEQGRRVYSLLQKREKEIPLTQEETKFLWEKGVRI